MKIFSLKIATIMAAFTALIPPALAEESLTGKWSGSYTCGQGLTLLDLALEDMGDGHVWGTFSFSATAENPQWPSGSFYIYGTYQSQSKKVELTAGPWIEQPRGYSSTGLVGDYAPQTYDPNTLTRAPARLAGRLLLEGCTTFQVERTNKPSALGQMPEQIRTRLAATAGPAGVEATGDLAGLRPFWGAWFGNAQYKLGMATTLGRRAILAIGDSPSFEIEGACKGRLVPLKGDGTKYEFQFDPQQGDCTGGKAIVSITENYRSTFDRKFLKFELHNEDRLTIRLAQPIQFLDKPVRFDSSEWYNHFAYVDDTSSTSNAVTLDGVKQTLAELKQEGWRCVISPNKSFARSERVNIVFDSAFWAEALYVIGCEGQCQEISYDFEAPLHRYVIHKGREYAAPVLYTRGSITFNVRRFGPASTDQLSQPAKETRVWIAELSKAPDGAGPGCDEHLQ